MEKGITNVKMRLEEEIDMRQKSLVKQVDDGLDMRSNSFIRQSEFIQGLVYTQAMIDSEIKKRKLINDFQENNNN